MNVKIVIIALLIGILSACSGGGGNGGNPAPSLVSIAVTPANPNITLGTTQQFTATGTYSDGSSQDITGSATWSSADTAVATVSSTGLATAKAAGTSAITARTGSVSGIVVLTVSPLSLSMVKKVTLTGSGDGGSARPEVIATPTRVFALYLGHISEMGTKTFDVKIYDEDITTVIAAKTIVSPTTAFGSPTDIRVASDGQSLFAFYETYSDSTGTTYLWGAKYTLNDNFERTAATAAPIAVSKHIVNPPDGHELLDDPAPLIGPNSVFVVTRYDYSIARAGNTIYHVREFSRDTLVQLSEFALDLSSVADGRGRVTSLLSWNNSIYMALATSVSDQSVYENNDDGARCNIILVKMKSDWTFDPALDVHTISAEPDDWENYITGLRADGNYFYLSYKQAIGSPPTGEQRAVIKIFDNSFNLLYKEIVKSVIWGPEGGEIRPSLEVSGNRIFSGQSAGQGIGTGNAEVYIYQRN